jgi:hypothetical protein
VRQKLLRKLFAVAIAVLPLTAAFIVACASDTAGNKGAACDRASDCVGGLICAANVCTDDLSKLDGGTAANFNDTGMAMPADAGDEGGEAAPPMDGMPPVDTGTPPEDTGTMPIDTGTMPVDTGTVPVDTGTEPVDTGTPPDDAASD